VLRFTDLVSLIRVKISVKVDIRVSLGGFYRKSSMKSAVPFRLGRFTGFSFFFGFIFKRFFSV
jgi:hypothetical protein